ncbi:MAG: hypothetical protein MRERV_1c068 [Mycoplasmataceae bacterium RV_VA103A]|nr:MAG: hypothetical protein MRERV_1c068 [Mycoplasmataceae bacterium RV_VA103A]
MFLTSQSVLELARIPSSDVGWLERVNNLWNSRKVSKK